MAEHTAIPWRVEEGTTLIWGACVLYEDGAPNYLGFPVASAETARSWSTPAYPSAEVQEANAAFIVKCVNSHAELVAALKQAGGYLANGNLADAFVRDGVLTLVNAAIARAEAPQ
jgi:hypothetical protein